MSAETRKIWAHNALFGAAAMIKSNARRIIESPTATGEAKLSALSIMTLADALAQQLKTRVK